MMEAIMTVTFLTFGGITYEGDGGYTEQGRRNSSSEIIIPNKKYERATIWNWKGHALRSCE